MARHLSIAGHPFLLTPASVAAVAVLRGGEVGPAVALAALFVAVSAALLLGIRTGHFNDFDVSERQRRPGFYVLVTGATLALGFWLRDEPAALRTSAIAGALLVACGVLNRWTKVSLHTAFAVYVAGYWGAWSIGAGLGALAVAGGIAWSRVHLGRHSRGEVQLGAMIGLVAAAALHSANTVPTSGRYVDRQSARATVLLARLADDDRHRLS